MLGKGVILCSSLMSTAIAWHKPQYLNLITCFHRCFGWVIVLGQIYTKEKPLLLINTPVYLDIDRTIVVLINNNGFAFL